MAAYTIIYGDTADTAVAVSGVIYDSVRNSTAATTYSTSTTFLSGQHFATGTYYIYQVFLVFDTSAVPAGSANAVLSVNATSATGAGEEWQVREASSLSNKIAGGSLGNLNLFGTAFIPTAVGRSIISIADIAAMSRSATTILLLHSKNELDYVSPSGAERATINSADASGTTSDPYLVISNAGSWEFVGVSSVVEATTDNITLVETGISGLQAGDLLVACIAYRSASGGSDFSPPAADIWSVVAQERTDNTATTTSAIASGAMFYGIRGASAPGLTFTRTAGANVALGRIVAYRNVAQISPLDANNGGATTAVNTTAVSLTGLTTTQDNDLVVAMFAGGQEATVTYFAAATDPTASSRTGSSITSHPAPNAWLERADSVTTTGADTALSIFDAVKLATGATGNLTCTASQGAAHVIVAGAFKIAVEETPTMFGSAALALSGTAVGTGAGALHGTAAMAIAGTAVPFVNGVLVGTAAITTTGSAVLSGSGKLSGAADAAFTATATASGVGALVGTATATFTGASALSGVGALFGTAALLFEGTASSIPPEELAGTAALAFTGTGSLTASGRLIATADITIVGSAIGSGTGSLAGATALTISGMASGTLTGALHGSTALSFSANAVPIQENALAGTATILVTAVGIPSATGALVGSASLAFSAAAQPYQPGVLHGLAEIGFVADAAIAAIGALNASAQIATGATSTLSGSAALVASSQIVLTATGFMGEPAIVLGDMNYLRGSKREFNLTGSSMGALEQAPP